MKNRAAMVGWYDPAMLAKTGIRVAISTVFGQFADKREAFAAANAIAPQPFDKSFDYSVHNGNFWFDFIADTGDGWNSTYAVARLLAQETIAPGAGAKELPRGKILVMGGDEVYPTASREEYGNRLLAPYELAHEPEKGKPAWPPKTRPDLYAVPGNHDWYDGLNAFFGLFCRRRIAHAGMIGAARSGKVIGGRQTHQTRSYFAIRLPGDWWLWGTDSQLEGYIDQPQIEYFQHVASAWMPPGSKLILCVGQPSWEYVDNAKPDKAFSYFSYLERLAGAARDASGQTLGHKLKLVLSGDAHHYARYVEGDRHYVTCGGGGAFLHPTHHLEDKDFDWPYPQPGLPYDRAQQSHQRKLTIADAENGKKALYPDPATSRRLTLGNFAFAFKNWKFPALLMFPAFFLLTWLMNINAQLEVRQSLADIVSQGNLCDALGNYWLLAVASPAAAFLLVGAFFGCRYFSDVENGWGRTLVGGLHAAAHGATVSVVTCLIVRATAAWWASGLGEQLASLVLASAGAALASATVFGLYLVVSLFIFNRHWNEAFSSLAHEGFKSLLRFRIDGKGSLTMFPIGLDKVPDDRRDIPENPLLSPHLIEGPVPIG